MATEKITQAVPEEQVSTAEDTNSTIHVQDDVTENVAEVVAEQPQKTVAVETGAVAEIENAAGNTEEQEQTVAESEVASEDAEITTAVEETIQNTSESISESVAPVEEIQAVSSSAAEQEQAVDFSDEEAALAADAPEFDLGEKSEEEKEEEQKTTAIVELSGMTKVQLLDRFAELLSSKPIQSLRKDVEAIKVAFYKIHRAEVEESRKTYLEQGGVAEDFAPAVDNNEQRLKDLFTEYRKRRDEFISNLEKTKEDNLKVKLAIIDELKELVNSSETMGNTFHTFRDLQQRWKDVGPVPQANVKDLWETYNHHVENFYSYIKINKELRDLDLKKNYEAKIALCEEAESLILEPSIVNAFHRLQKLHEQWRETGPVANEYKETLWERFREASSRINKQHQEYFEGIKDEQKANLELKTELCVKTEELASGILTTRKEWNKASDKLLEIQKIWKTIGFAPKKDNARIYERFRNACDKFFEQKRNFYLQAKAEMEHNLELKNEICEAAEALRESEDWKKTTDELISLQKRWKEIGPVARRHSDAVWKRFRSACDHFFNRKSGHFSSKDAEYDKNLTLKKELLAEIGQADILAGGFDMIKDFQRRWSEIGYVPIKQKDAIQKEYKEAMDKAFAILRSSGHSRQMDRFKDKVSNMKESGDKRLRYERDRLYNKVRQLESEIALLENNIGFFANSKNAEAMIKDVRDKIARAKEEMAAAIEKINLIDNQQ